MLSLDVGGVATSGNATRGVHVLDPRSQRWVTRDGSVTVRGPDLVWADVWATAAFVDPAAAGELMTLRDPDYEMVLL